jgi:hypothetical protein
MEITGVLKSVVEAHHRTGLGELPTGTRSEAIAVLERLTVDYEALLFHAVDLQRITDVSIDESPLTPVQETEVLNRRWDSVSDSALALMLLRPKVLERLGERLSATDPSPWMPVFSQVGEHIEERLNLREVEVIDLAVQEDVPYRSADSSDASSTAKGVGEDWIVTLSHECQSANGWKTIASRPLRCGLKIDESTYSMALSRPSETVSLPPAIISVGLSEFQKAIAGELKLVFVFSKSGTPEQHSVECLPVLTLEAQSASTMSLSMRSESSQKAEFIQPFGPLWLNEERCEVQLKVDETRFLFWLDLPSLADRVRGNVR